MIKALVDVSDFKRRRKEAWERNLRYWLAGNLRHVVDVGPYIARRVRDLCQRNPPVAPAVLDMGFGSAWLLEALLREGMRFSYLGVDSTPDFVTEARRRFSGTGARFIQADLEEKLTLGEQVDIAVNAFNFFELCDLQTAMQNAAKHLRPGGRLFMSTIDKTYLILALSGDWNTFHENLRLYQELPGVKFDFQRIDLGDGVSKSLEYPSVLYSTQDYIAAAQEFDLHLKRYDEHAFTGRPIPKIYCHLEFEKSV